MISNKENNFISAVIYVYNKEKEIRNILEKIDNILKNNFKKYEIICVNDASTDNSVKEIKNFAESLQDEVLTIINMSYYQGIELSMNAGVDLAIGDFVYEFDNTMNDYSDDIIIDAYNKCLEGYDIVSATSKSNKNKTSSIFYKIFNAFSDINNTIHTDTFKIISRRAINRVNSMSKNIPYRKAMYANCGLNSFDLIYEPNKKVKRKFDKNMQKSRKDTAINSLMLFTDIGYKFSIIMSMIMIVITCIVAIYTITIFAVGKPVGGWTTTMLFLSCGFFGVFVIMTIMIKYLELILSLVFKENQYIIESVEKLH